MESEERVEARFRKDLKKLLEKYNAEITLDDRGQPYMTYQVIEISISATYTKDYEQLSHSFDFDL